MNSTTTAGGRQKPTLLLVHYNADSTGSSLERIAVLVEHFSKRFQVLLLVPQPGRVSERLASLPVQILYRALHEYRNPVSYAFHLLRFALFLRRHRIRGICFLDYVWWKPAEQLAAKFLSVPTAAMVNFYRPESAAGGFLRDADLIIPNSHRTAMDFYDSGLGDKTRVIHNFVDAERYQNAVPIRSELRDGSGPLIGFVGVLHPIKGVEVLLQAMPEVIRRHPNARLAIIGGEKEPGLRAKLESRADHLGILDAVRFLGHRDDVPNVMASLDILIVPSLDEPFGFINIEAGAAGIPVIASRVGGIPEILSDQQTGILVKPEDPQAISAAVDTLLNDPALRRRLGTALAQRVREYFSKERALAEWDEVIDELWVDD